MKTKISIILFLLSITAKAQFAVKNYSNAPVDQISTIKQIADWIQFDESENIYPFITETTLVDMVYLKIESAYLSKEYSRAKVDSNKHIEVKDDREVFWYERNIYKVSGNKLKPRYQIYITVDYSDGAYSILDIKFGKNKKINTSQYDQN